jgi:PKD repeat protein
MRIYFNIILFVVLLFGSTTMYGQGGYNPGNPPEPNALYSLDLQVSPNGAGNFSGNGNYAAGISVHVSAGNSAGFRFKSWNIGEQIVSTTASFYYTMPAQNVVLTAIFEYDPGNPGDPIGVVLPKKWKLYLEAQPVSGGYFNITSGNAQEEEKDVYLYAYNNTGFRFIEWRDGENVISTNRSFYYKMPSENKTLTALYVYDPANPGDPNTPQDIEHGLSALAQYGERGQTIAFPIYLLNHNLSVQSVDFDIAFPEGTVVDYNNTILTGRGNGHVVTVTDTQDNTFHYAIASTNNADFSESNGILIYIPVTLPEQWTPETLHPVTIGNVVMGTASGVISSSAHNGALGIYRASDYVIRANFYANKFLNRVYFTNLSSESATNFSWSFGDGNSSTEKNPLHIYDNSGTYEVRLIASDDYEADTLKTPIEITPENTWNVSGTLSLNKHKTDVKNFTSVSELFFLLARTEISGDISINTEAGETFEIPVSNETINLLSTLKTKLASGDKKLIFRKDGETTRPAIHFTGSFDAASVTAILEWGRYIETENVDILIFNNRIDIPALYRYPSQGQRICSGSQYEPVDFTTLGNTFTYKWSLTVEPASLSGYFKTGTNGIPQAVLTNTSSITDSLVYKVSVVHSLAAETELFAFRYKIEVAPSISGEIRTISPTNEQVLSNTTITLSWSSVTNASSYELFVWETELDEPSEASVINIRGTTYQSSAMFKYGKSYHWKVAAVNECNRIVSETASFTVRLLPDLHVSGIVAPVSADAGQQIEVVWEVKNDGAGATLASEYWVDKIWLIKNLQSANTTNYGYLLYEKHNRNALDANEFYSDTTKVRIPDYLAGNYYMVVTSDINDIVSIDWTPVGNQVPVPYAPNISGTPYPYLKAQTSSGYSRILEEHETNTLTDNFFYKQLTLSVPDKLPDLQVKSIEIPDNIIEKQTFTAKATIVNTGEATLSGRTWIDGVYVSKEPGFDPSAASLLSVNNSTYTLEQNDEYVLSFELTAPVDSAADYYFHFVTDIHDAVYELNDNNNRQTSAPVRVNPYLMDEDDYSVLTDFYLQTGGPQWKQTWNTASKRIHANWQGVTFFENRVTAISLPANLLTGTIPASVSELPYLTDLNLSHNRLIVLEDVLPERIVNLNLGYQTFEEDSIRLVANPDFQIPSIAKYDHAGRNFDFYPNFGLYKSSVLLLNYNRQGDRYVRKYAPQNPRDFIWTYVSGTDFTLIQGNGSTTGSTRPVKVYFDAGDANMDDQINVLDIQHSLNYIFNEHANAFNFTAADTYKDDAITIQDLILTVNIILDAFGAPVSPSPKSPNTASAEETNNLLYVENGKLVLYTEKAVAAMEITLEGISENELTILPEHPDFQYTVSMAGDKTKFIAYSLTGKTIPSGIASITQWTKPGVTIIDALFSDAEAEQIPVTIKNAPTGISLQPEELFFRVANRGDRIIYYSGGNIDRMTASLYSIQGALLGKQVVDYLKAGEFSLAFKINTNGVYILNLQLKTGGQTISKNVKLIF